MTLFWSHNGPFSRHVGIFHGLKRVTLGSKWAKNICLSIPNGPGSLLEKCVFDPFLTRFWSQNGLFSRHFGIFHGPKHVTMSAKWAKNTCLSIPSGRGTTLEKTIFSASGTLVDPLLAPTVRGPGCPPAPPREQFYGGLGISGDSEAWKPQKVGHCGWNTCPQNFDLSHVAQDDTKCVQSGPFSAIFGPFLGHIVELEGNKGLFVTGQSRSTLV